MKATADAVLTYPLRITILHEGLTGITFGLRLLEHPLPHTLRLFWEQAPDQGVL